MGVHSRSFLKGKRFAFRRKDQLMCCERCVFGTGKHTCVTSSESSRKPAKTWADPGYFTSDDIRDIQLIQRRLRALARRGDER